jgi:3-oxoacyl-[acyl-carrier protein] reductase
MTKGSGMFDLTGKTALVTGASGGIGAVIAATLAQAGARLVLSGTNADKLATVAATLKTPPVIVTANLKETEAAAQLVADAEQALGAPVDILVNNAGLTRDTLVMRMKDEDWNTVLDVNLSACFRLSRAVLRGMMKNRWGRIINITSVVGAGGNAGQGNYCAAKAGLTGFSKALAQEVASRGITVNCIAPGFITTAMTDKLSDDIKTATLSRIPAGCFGEPADIAAAAVYLAAPAARYVTGQTLHVNGGMLMAG